MMSEIRLKSDIRQKMLKSRKLKAKGSKPKAESWVIV